MNTSRKFVNLKRMLNSPERKRRSFQQLTMSYWEEENLSRVITASTVAEYWGSRFILFHWKSNLCVWHHFWIRVDAGNIKLGLIIDQYRERYLEAGRCDKAIISQHVVDFVHGYGGRFLKRSESNVGEWIEVSLDAACDKVGHGFRAKPKRSTTPIDQQNTQRQVRQDGNVNEMGRPFFLSMHKTSPAPHTKQSKRQRAGSKELVPWN